MAVAGNRTRISANDACTTRRWAWFGLLVSLAVVTGCGGGTLDAMGATPANAATHTPAEPEAPPPAPSAPADGDSEIDALLHDLRVQKDRVDRELARKQQLAVARAEEAENAAPQEEAAPAATPKTSPAAKPSKKKDAPAAATPAAGPRDADQASSDWVGSPCDTACRALASMERSTERICALAGETDTRCASARSMVKASRERVQASGCWCRSFGPR